ncbi:PAS domain S-box protein [Dankookia rubra]|uniref:histidine kinase n=1 Tax=Dankookia rubra TaxID=1442381 RepID=A0A4R5Q598_9PROT|nr:PAS domain S-box protein [Dankookia rubra]TDH58084.1 PAS domain S-box protein [Dankookia rubra]
MQSPENGLPAFPLKQIKLRGLRAHIVALVAASLLPAFAVGGIAVWAAVGSYRQAFDDRLEGTAKALASAVETEIASHTLALFTLATARDLDRGGDLASFHERARQVAAMFSTRIFLVAPGGSLLLHTYFPADAEFADRQQRESIDMARQVVETGLPAIGNLLSGQVTGRWVAPVYVPVIRDGQVTYTLGIALEADRISRMLAGHASRDGGYASLVDGNGRIMARSTEPERYVGQTVRGWVTDGAQEGEAGTLRGPNRSGIEIVTAFRRIPGAAGWFVTVAEPLSTYHASLRGPLAMLAIGGMAAVVLALAVAVWIGGRVLRPVDWLTQKAERVASTSGAAEIMPAGPPVRVQEFERLRAAVLQAHVALREKAQAVAVGEARLRAILDTAADAIVVTDERGTMLSFNRAAEATFGYTGSEAVGQNIATLICADDDAHHDVCLATYLQTSERKAVGVGREVEGKRKDDSLVPLDLSISDWQDAAGERFFTAIMRDISARKATEARQDILVREVDHRAKNILAVVQSVLRLTPRDQPGAFAAAETRVAGLARVHSLLAEGGWLGADLRAVAERELAAFGAGSSGVKGGPMVSFEGPPAALAPPAVQPLAMVLHELATNAAKHGALSTPGGRVKVRWIVGRRKGEDGLLRLRWAEEGGPSVACPPARRGFGTRVVEATVRGQLGGTVERHWERTGLVVEIAVPVARVLAGAEAAASASANPERRASAA